MMQIYLKLGGGNNYEKSMENVESIESGQTNHYRFDCWYYSGCGDSGSRKTSCHFRNFICRCFESNCTYISTLFGYGGHCPTKEWSKNKYENRYRFLSFRNFLSRSCRGFGKLYVSYKFNTCNRR